MYAVTFLIYFDISFDFEMKRKTNQKRLYYFKKKKKREKKLNLHPQGIEPRPNDSESDMLSTQPSMHMALTHDQAQNTCD